MKEVSVNLVRDESGEWSGLFVNGILECEGHNVYERDWIKLIRKYKYFNEIESFTINDEYLENLGSFPFKFNDIPIDVLR